MSYDYDDDEPAVPHLTIDAELHLTTPALDLTTPVRGGTLADLICRAALDKLAKSPAWPTLSERVRTITDEEIRAHVIGLIQEALTGEIRRTNAYGEPVGEPTTLRELISKEATTALGRPTNEYGRSGTVLQKLIREEVTQAMKAELAGAIAEERAKVTAAVRAQAAQLIAEAVTKGIGH